MKKGLKKLLVLMQCLLLIMVISTNVVSAHWHFNFVPVTGIELNKTQLNLTYDWYDICNFDFSNDTYQLYATVSPSNASFPYLRWESSNPWVAGVFCGRVMGFHEGTATIAAIATDGSGVKATCQVIVSRPTRLVTSLVLTPGSITLNKGDKNQVAVTVYPSNATNKTINWTSNNNSIVTVDSNGVVTGIEAGTATITASAADGSGIRATCQVTVNQPTIPAITGVDVKFHGSVVDSSSNIINSVNLGDSPILRVKQDPSGQISINRKPQDIVLLLDVSGSMGSNSNSYSKMYKAINAAKSFVDKLSQKDKADGINDRVGIAVFNSFGWKVCDLESLISDTQVTDLKNKLSNIDSIGKYGSDIYSVSDFEKNDYNKNNYEWRFNYGMQTGTDLKEGLLAVNDMLSNTDSSRNESLVLLTDGMTNINSDYETPVTQKWVSDCWIFGHYETVYGSKFSSVQYAPSDSNWHSWLRISDTLPVYYYNYNNTQSKNDAQVLLMSMHQNNLSAYLMGVSSSASDSIDSNYMSSLANSVNGYGVTLSSADDMANVYNNIASYLLYQRDYKNIQITIPLPNGLTVSKLPDNTNWKYDSVTNTISGALNTVSFKNNGGTPIPSLYDITLNTNGAITGDGDPKIYSSKVYNLLLIGILHHELLL